MENRENIPCVELRNVVKRFPGVTAVDHVNLKVEQGKVFSLLGPSGCGRPRLCGWLLDWRPWMKGMS